MTTTSASSSPPVRPASPVWWRRLRWRVVAASAGSAGALLIVLSKVFGSQAWSETKVLTAIGSALLFLGALAQVVAESDEVKSSERVSKDAFVLFGWLLVVTGAAFTFLGVLAS
jgi:VIT1/CCC1 family predicted Fe2+/Mn2+ transporter